ncbi:PEBP-like protein [Epithele typhae]|uniref:PEBP-like protein n=1 Tax=Epithele typhae TaxID=378194 RepID=UPI0020079A56|nr:PEBP-like protein [Epithele typhae]KAH9945089.1 PEBP-like protein [Epithele typhae]
MRASAAAAAFFFASSVSALTPTDVENALKNVSIIPDDIADFTPKALLDVTYTDSTSNQSIVISPGLPISVNQTTMRPQYALTSSDASLTGQRFVLIMFDPDAPTPQNRSLAQVRHLVAQVQLSSDTAALASGAGSPLTNSTPAVSDYISPGPPPGGAHR